MKFIKKISKFFLRPFIKPLLNRINLIVHEELQAALTTTNSTLEANHKELRKLLDFYLFFNEVNEAAVNTRIRSVSHVFLEKEEKYFSEKIAMLLKRAHNYKIVQVYQDVLPKENFPFKNYEEKYSPLDKLGNLLFIIDENGNTKHFRGIYPDKVDFFMKLFSSGILQSFAEEGIFVDIKLTKYYTDVYPLIIELETLFMFPLTAWTYSMLKEAAICFLLMKKALNALGYTFLDGHRGNITFKKNLPCFFDVGSIVEFSGNDVSKNEFENHIIIPLLLQSVSSSSYNRVYIETIPNRLPPSQPLNRSLEYITIRNKFIKFHKENSCFDYNIIVHNVLINKIFIPEYISILFQPYWDNDETLWGNYSNHLSSAPTPITTSRYARVIELIKKYCYSAKTVLDVGGNNGYFCSLLDKEKLFTRIISADYDETAIENGLKHLKNTNVILANSYINREFKSDILVALAVTHHMLLTDRHDIDFILSRFGRLSNKYVFIEFCPLGMYSNQIYKPDVPSYYTEDWFEQHFMKHFILLHKECVAFVTINGIEEKHRVLFVGKKL